MSAYGSEAASARDLPTFSECVLGYRRWRVDEHNRLWPLWVSRRPWMPGANTARCNCKSSAGLRFVWSEFDGRRVLEPAPQHDAPDQHCVCGLYSWRLPQRSWQTDVSRSTPPSVVGAVASWGRIQVHADGFRAEHACVVLLAHHPSVGDKALSRLSDIGELYRVDVVRVEELEERARAYGSPLPTSVLPAPTPLDEPAPRRPANWLPRHAVREVYEAENTGAPSTLLLYVGAGLMMVIGLVIAGLWLVQHGAVAQVAANGPRAAARTPDFYVFAGISVFTLALGLIVLGAAHLAGPIGLWIQFVRLRRDIRRHRVHEAS